MVAGAGSTRLVDTKGLVKIDPYHGEREKFLAWKWEFYVAVRSMSVELAGQLQFVENHLNDDYSINRLNDTEKVQAGELFTILALLCKGEAASYIMNSEDGNGYAAWRDLCKSKMVRSSTALMRKLMEPEFTNVDPRVNLKQWKKDAQAYFEKTGERVPDSIKPTVYVNKAAPHELRQHLMMNQTRLHLSDDVADEIEEYCDAMEDYGQGRDGIVAATQQGWPGGIGQHGEHYDYDDDDSGIVAAQTGGKRGAKGDKSHLVKGKGKDKGKMADGKGKLHKGLGKAPERGEQRRFGGLCNWCWRIGHKEAQCWFNMEYMRSPDSNDSNAKVRTPTPKPQQDASAGSRDIRTYFGKRDKPDSGQAMDVGAVLPNGRQPFVFAVTYEECGNDCTEAAGIPIPDNDDDDLDLSPDVDGQIVKEGFIFAVTEPEVVATVSRKDTKPMVDSGSVVSTCPKDYDPTTPCVDTAYKINLVSVLGEKLTHYGYKDGVQYRNSKGNEMRVGYEVTDSTRPILSVQKSSQNGQMTVFGPSASKIIKDKSVIEEIERLIKDTEGFDIILEDGAYVIDAEVVPQGTSGKPAGYACPVTAPGEGRVVSTGGLERAIKNEEKVDAQREHEADIHTGDIVEAEMSHSVKVKIPAVPYVPSQKEKIEHEATHCPYRAWCPACVAGKALERRHMRATKEEGQLPCIEFDFSFGSDKTDAADSKITMCVACDSAHQSIISPMVQKKGASDEYVMQSFLQWIDQLGLVKAEIK